MSANAIVACSRCHCRHRAEDFGANRLGERMKTCSACRADTRQRAAEYRARQLADPAARDAYHARARASFAKYTRNGRRCEHRKYRDTCRVCRPGTFCEHGCRQTSCVRCNLFSALTQLSRKRIHNAIGPQGRGGYQDLLGCDAKTLAAHLEAKFIPGISWDNYGSAWEMDHIVGICEPNAAGVYPTDAEKRARLHYTNIQALATSAHRVKTATAPRAKPITPPTRADIDAYIDELLE